MKKWWSVEKARVPKLKPVLDTPTQLAMSSAHRQGRHGSGDDPALAYWAGMCPVCWIKATSAAVA